MSWLGNKKKVEYSDVNLSWCIIKEKKWFYSLKVKVIKSNKIIRGKYQGTSHSIYILYDLSYILLLSIL